MGAQEVISNWRIALAGRRKSKPQNTRSQRTLQRLVRPGVARAGSLEGLPPGQTRQNSKQRGEASALPAFTGPKLRSKLGCGCELAFALRHKQQKPLLIALPSNTPHPEAWMCGVSDAL